MKMHISASTTHKSHHHCFWRRHCCQNNVQTCAGSQRLRLTKIPSIIAPFFSLINTSPRSLSSSFFPVSYSISADAVMRSFLFHSGSSHSPRLRQCLNVNEFCISDIIHPLTSHSPYGSFDNFKAKSGDRLRRDSDPLSAARRFAKSIAANEGSDKQKTTIQNG